MAQCNLRASFLALGQAQLECHQTSHDTDSLQFFFKCCFTFTKTVGTIRDGETLQLKCCFTSAVSYLVL